MKSKFKSKLSIIRIKGLIYQQLVAIRMKKTNKRVKFKSSSKNRSYEHVPLELKTNKKFMKRKIANYKLCNKIFQHKVKENHLNTWAYYKFLSPTNAPTEDNIGLFSPRWRSLKNLPMRLIKLYFECEGWRRLNFKMWRKTCEEKTRIFYVSRRFSGW